jgi:glycerophosphoryl diester phosphodiesterase
MICIGHRGAAGYAPENTLLSIQKALDLGCEWVEIDLQRFGDELYLFHDRRLDRMTGASGLASNLTPQTTALLKVGNTESIPDLKTLFISFRGRAKFHLELKGQGTAELLVEALRGALRDGWSESDFVLSSFDHRELAICAKLLPEIKRGVLIYGVPHGWREFCREISAWSLHLSINFVDADLIREAKEENLRAYVYTVNHLEDFRLMQQLGVDGVFSDYPDRIESLRQT